MPKNNTATPNVMQKAIKKRTERHAIPTATRALHKQKVSDDPSFIPIADTAAIYATWNIAPLVRFGLALLDAGTLTADPELRGSSESAISRPTTDAPSEPGKELNLETSVSSSSGSVSP